MKYFNYDSPLGNISVVTSTGKIQRIFLPQKSVKALKRAMEIEFPYASKSNGQQAVEIKAKAWLDDFFQGKELKLNWTFLESEALTGFQEQVLRACSSIPRGQTLSYAELSQKIDRPLAARATGSALGRNPFPLLIPCHRVIKADKKLGLFSAPGGSNTKAKLLSLEGTPQLSKR